MVRKYIFTAAALLLLTAATACAAPQTELSPAVGTEGGASNADVPAVEPQDGTAATAALTSGPVSTGALLPGMSAKSTRGHVWAEPVIEEDEVAIALAVATSGDHVHFEVPDGDRVVGFIGYFCDDEFCVRANFCPLCGAERIESGWSLLVCRSCGVTFDTFTGESEGGTANFPSGTVPYTVDGDRITMSLAHLLEAHARTVAGEDTLFEEPEVVEDEDDGDTSWPRCCRR